MDNLCDAAHRAYWWVGRKNFGDALAPLLLERFAYLKTEWAPSDEARIVSVGSVLEHLPCGWRGVVVGAGKLREAAELKLEEATILAIRGPLTAKGVRGDYAIGDPGILASELVGWLEAEHALGIVPHWSDRTLVPKILAELPPNASVTIIDVTGDPLDVLRAIGGCKSIVTSSLHGMIVADAFGIPRRVEYSPTLAKEGGDYKFRDYSASVRMTFEAGKMGEPVRAFVEDVQFAVYDAYRALEGCA